MYGIEKQPLLPVETSSKFADAYLAPDDGLLGVSD
jgi:hypothetical protein